MKHLVLTPFQGEGKARRYFLFLEGRTGLWHSPTYSLPDQAHFGEAARQAADALCGTDNEVLGPIYAFSFMNSIATEHLVEEYACRLPDGITRLQLPEGYVEFRSLARKEAERLLVQGEYIEAFERLLHFLANEEPLANGEAK